MRTKSRIAWVRTARIQTVSRHKLRFPSDRDPVGGNGAACVRDELNEDGSDQFSGSSLLVDRTLGHFLPFGDEIYVQALGGGVEGGAGDA